MPWDKNDYPPSMKNLEAKVRTKAIEIANSLVEDGYEEGRAISIATEKAKEWASNRDSLKENRRDQHIIFRDNKWIILKEENDQASYAFDKKSDAIEKGKELARNQNVQLIIHKMDGKIQEVII